MGEKPLEVEVKFLVENLDAVRSQLQACNADLKKPRVFEHNVRFDTLDEALRHGFKLLRLRKDTAVKVTFKGPAEEDLTSEAKVREELEMEVSDFDTAAAIFKRLGFEPLQVYEKYRETWQLGDVEVVLDEMPFGHFVELEGKETAIKSAAAQLNLDWQKRSLDNYLNLMGTLKAHHNLTFDDLTFANFENISASAADLIEVST